MDGIVTREDAMDFVSRNWQDLLLGALVVGLGGALLAAFAFTRPAERTETRFVPYEHVTTFEYTAQAPPEVVYDGAEPEPGETPAQTTTRIEAAWTEHTIEYTRSRES